MWDPNASPPAQSGFWYLWVNVTLSQTSEMSGLSSNHPWAGQGDSEVTSPEEMLDSAVFASTSCQQRWGNQSM